jgi:hypothetical protein
MLSLSSVQQDIITDIPTHPFPFDVPCPYCLTVLQSHLERQRHILLNPSCNQAYLQDREEHMQLLHAKRALPQNIDTALLDGGSCTNTLQVTSPPSPVPVDDSTVAPIANQSTHTRNAEDIGRPTKSTKLHPATSECVESPHNIPTSSSQSDNSIFIEEFPNPSAGAPISGDKAYSPDPGLFLKSCGNLGEPKYFEMAELLMTTGLSNSSRERFIKSTMVSGI